MDLILEKLKPFVPWHITSKNIICLSFILFSGNKVQIFQGKTSGFIANSPQGSSESFGWDPIFIPTDFNTSNLLSYAQLDKKIKNEISHRGKALQKLMDHLKEKEKE